MSLRTWLLKLHIIGIREHLLVSFCGWESMYVLLDLVTEHMRMPTEEGLSSDDLHRHDRVELTLQFLTGLLLVSLQ